MRFALIVALLLTSGTSAFAESDQPPILEGRSRIDLTVSPGNTGVSPEQIRAWVTNAAHVVAGYYGRFPVPRVSVNVTPSGGGHVGSGVTYGGRWIRIGLGDATTARDLSRDWVLIHEMFHTAFPEMDDPHHWMEEGLSTYLEPLARARVGQLTAEQVWHEWVVGMPQGLPDEDSRGMNHTPTWGSTYWGGCRFWLMADLEIRAATDGKKTLADALKAILAAGGNGAHPWKAERVFEVGDRATGTQVLAQLHTRMGEHAEPADLAGLWKQLGVELTDGEIRFHNDAPEASLRKSLLER
jgi:hypothetical protein